MNVPQCHTTHEKVCKIEYNTHCEDRHGKKGKNERVEHLKIHKVQPNKWKRSADEDYASIESKMEELAELEGRLLEGEEDMATEPERAKRFAYLKGALLGGAVTKKLLRKKASRDERVCHHIPKEVCHDVPKECWTEPKQKCRKVPEQKCWSEPKESCVKVPHE